MRLSRYAAVFLIAFLFVNGCNFSGRDKVPVHGADEKKKVEGVIVRYNQLLSEGYKRLNMNHMAEVTTEEQARKLYFHMSAIGEGRMKMDSTLKNLEFRKVDFPKPDEAMVETKEIWDYTHYRIDSGEKFAEEKDFIYLMGYMLNKKNGKWIVTGVNVVSGTSTHTTLPWPEVGRTGNISRSGTAGKSLHR